MNIKELKKIGIKNMVLLLAAGIFLLICTMPGIFKEESEVGSNTEESREADITVPALLPVPSAEERLEAILSRIEGVGKTEVMIFYNSSEELVPLLDEKGSFVRTAQDEEGVCIMKTNAPKMEGVLVVAEGAKKAEVIQYISDATEALFGIPKHKIIVLPMRSESGSN